MKMTKNEESKLKMYDAFDDMVTAFACKIDNLVYAVTFKKCNMQGWSFRVKTWRMNRWTERWEIGRE